MALKALFRVRLLGLKSSLTGASRSSRKRSRAQLIGFSVLMLYTFGYFAFMMYGLFQTLAGPFLDRELGGVYFAFAALLCFSMMFVGSVFSAKAQLFEATDNDLLLSMPIRPGEILLSRMLLLFVMDLLFGAVVSAPALIAWFQAAGLSAALIPCLLVFELLLPALALLAAAFFGWLLHLASARVRNQSMLTVVLSLGLLAVYFVAISRMNSWITGLAQDPTPLAEALGSVALLVWLGRACAAGDLIALAGLALGTAAVFLAGWLILSRDYVRAATESRGAAKIKYVEKAAETLSPDRALLRRELKRLAASPSYILNGALGVLMAPIAAVYLVIRRGALLALLQDPSMAVLLPMALLLGLCFVAATSILTAPSISLEGKTLWLLRSLPVTPRQVLLAKLKLHLLVCLPALQLSALVFVLVIRPEPALALCYFAVPAAFSLFSGLLGLFENLRHPFFDWVNETQAVKSGMSVMLTLFIGWGVMLLPMIAFFALPLSGGAVALGFLALLLLLCLLLWRWLQTRGEARFRAL